MYEDKSTTSTATLSNNEAEMDAFKSQFKYFKAGSSILPADKEDILAAEYEGCVVTPMEVVDVNESEGPPTAAGALGLKPVSSWKVFKFTFPEGLIFIKNPFTPEGQRYWISTCLKNYVKPPHLTNISNLQNKASSEKRKEKECSDNMLMYKHLRWVTFGYHHCWDTKVYSYDNRCDFPKDLRELTKYMAELLGFSNFEPEAAIVNYYHLDSTLSGHQDRSEETTDAPLFSISFGQAAIFLIGDETKDVKPAAVYLRSGDVVIMAGKSRKSFHGVPKILKTECKPWADVKQSSNETLESEPVAKKSKLGESTMLHSSYHIHNDALVDSTLARNASYWENFTNEYASQCRINLNVRQVLASGNHNKA